MKTTAGLWKAGSAAYLFGILFAGASAFAAPGDVLPDDTLLTQLTGAEVLEIVQPITIHPDDECKVPFFSGAVLCSSYAREQSEITFQRGEVYPLQYPRLADEYNDRSDHYKRTQKKEAVLLFTETEPGSQDDRRKLFAVFVSAGPFGDRRLLTIRDLRKAFEWKLRIRSESKSK